MFELIMMCIIAFMAFIGGVDVGENRGREQMHKQEYVCQTLPDKSIHCWENKENKNVSFR